MPNLDVNVGLAEFIDAIEKDGFEKATGSLFFIRKGKFSACALGQALINVGVTDEGEVREIAEKYKGDSIDYYGLPSNNEVYDTEGEGVYYIWLQKQFPTTPLFISRVYALNDAGKHSFSEIADILRKEYSLS